MRAGSTCRRALPVRHLPIRGISRRLRRRHPPEGDRARLISHVTARLPDAFLINRIHQLWLATENNRIQCRCSYYHYAMQLHDYVRAATSKYWA